MDDELDINEIRNLADTFICDAKNGYECRMKHCINALGINPLNHVQLYEMLIYEMNNHYQMTGRPSKIEYTIRYLELMNSKNLK